LAGAVRATTAVFLRVGRLRQLGKVVDVRLRLGSRDAIGKDANSSARRTLPSLRAAFVNAAASIATCSGDKTRTVFIISAF